MILWRISATSLLLTMALSGSPSNAREAAQADGEPVLEPPTLHCLGAYWLVRGDDDKDAGIAVHYRKAGS